MTRIFGEAATIVSSQPPRKNYILKDYFLTDPYNPDVLIVTYSASGVFQFARRIGHDGSEDAKAVTYDANGDLYVVGISRLYVVGIPGQTPTDRPNLFVRKYHGSNLLWEQKAGSSALWISEGTAPAVSVDSSGKVYVAGGFQHWARFGPSTLSGHGSSNMFVAELEGREFVMPFSGNLYFKQMGGEAGATTTFGTGTSRGNFVPYYHDLPNSPNPTGEVLVGFFPAGTTIHLGMFTQLGDESGWAFSDADDRASIVAFTDVDNSLGMGGSIIQQTGADTWLLHLDDALSYLYDDDDNDVLMQLRVAPSSAIAP